MHTTLSLIAATTTTVAGSKKSTSSSDLPLLILILLFAAGYFFIIRPRSQRMRQQQAASRQLEVGDEVVSAGGIHGRVVALHDDAVEVEVAAGVVMKFLRRAVNAAPRPAGGTVPGDQDDAFDDESPGSQQPGGAVDAGTRDSDGDHADGDHPDWDHPAPPPQAGDHEPGGTAGPAS
jgi:preprotein translocase subunit YajC